MKYIEYVRTTQSQKNAENVIRKFTCLTILFSSHSLFICVSVCVCFVLVVLHDVLFCLFAVFCFWSRKKSIVYVKLQITIIILLLRRLLILFLSLFFCFTNMAYYYYYGKEIRRSVFSI